MINDYMKNTGVSISFYAFAPAHKSRNAVVDSLNEWLTLNGAKITEIQMESPNPFELSEQKTIRVSMADGNAFLANPNVSYVRVKYLNYYAYYFVRKLRRSSNDTIEVDCELDILNTLHNASDLVSFSSPLASFNGRSVIEREHVNRFEPTAIGTSSIDLNSIIDKVAEGANLQLRQKGEDTPKYVEPVSNDALGYALDHDKEWYLIYATETTSSTPSTKIVCYLIPSKGGLSGVIGTTSKPLANMAMIDRTSSNIVKVIRCPYCPETMTLNGNIVTPTNFSVANVPATSVFWQTLAQNFYVLELALGSVGTSALDGIEAFERDLGSYKNLNFAFQRTILNGSLSERLSHLRYILDPKLDSSEFRGIYYVYDSAVWQLLPELFANDGTGLYIFPTYLQSTSVDSALMFKFEFSSGFRNASFIDGEFYPAIMTSNRKNEVAVFSSDYMNYIRNGYNYDRKKQTISEFVSIGGSVVGVASSLITANPLGAVASGLSLTKSIAGAVEAEIGMDKHIQELAAKNFNVSGINDSSLFANYGAGKLKLVETFPLDEEVKRWDDIFYYYGYNRAGRMGVPNINSRVWFNYLRGEMSFTDENNYPLWLMERAKDLFRQGVTFFHKESNQWDLNQTKENYEKALLGL